MAELDPVTFSVLWGGFLSVGEEMGVTLSRIAYSEAVREGLDFSTAMFDADGNLVAQGDFSPGHLGSMAFTVRRVFEDYPPETLEPGDAILVNVPHIGSGHLPDFFMINPIFLDTTLLGFTVNCAHHIDVGGSGAGSQTIEGISDNYQEGIRFLPTKCYARGEPIRDIFRIIAANVRVPEKVLGDLRAQYTANVVGGNRLRVLAEAHGVETVRRAMAEIIVRSEAEMREAIRRIPAGRYTFEDHLDDVGRNTPAVLAKVAVTVSDGEITVDWTGSSPQTESGVNCYLHYTYAYTIAAVKSVTLPMAPQNQGLIRTIKIVAPSGCFFNPIPPAPSGGRATVSHRIYETVMGALGQAVPELAIGANSHSTNPNLGGIDPRTGGRFVCYDLFMGGVGGRAAKDGVEALSSPWNAANIPVEIHEINAPVLIERLELICDSGGPGRFRGGLGLRKDVRVEGSRVRLYNLGDRAKFAPYGIFGGRPGQCARTVLNPGAAGERELHSKGTYLLEPADVVSWRLAGAGGYGNPLERDAALVLNDVVGGYVSLEAAARDYGVVIDPNTMTVDEVRTQADRGRRAGNPSGNAQQ